MRQVIIQDGDIKLNPSKDSDCVVCTLGLEHETIDKFFENFDKDLKEKMNSGVKRHELILHLLDNYSKTELVLALDNFITGRVQQISGLNDLKNVIGDILPPELKDLLGQANGEVNNTPEDPFKSIFDDLIGNKDE